MNIKEIFIMVCTEGITALKVKDELAIEFAHLLAEQVKDIAFSYVQSDYDYTDLYSDRIVIIENDYGPILKIIVNDEHVDFRVVDELATQEDMKIAGDVVMKCIGIISAWNIQIESIFNKKHLKSIASANTKYNSDIFKTLHKYIKKEDYNLIPKHKKKVISDNTFDYI
tara:strand:+ start:83 stop:589 length:507 start_codon:yes stop_codon:yes gene_type:complete